MATTFVFRLLTVVFLATEIRAFAPTSKLAKSHEVSSPHQGYGLLLQSKFENKDDGAFDPIGLQEATSSSASWKAATASALVPLVLSLPAEAASGGAPFPSAVAAYVHYVSLLIIAGCVSVERFTVKAGMTDEEQDLLSFADIMIGVFGTTLVVSGYYRIVEYGKGWDFYSHEPVFWLKIALVGIFGALSFFPTTTIIKRAIIKQQTGSYPVMSEKLASRMQTVLNGELTALLSIPLSATVMARGIGYNDEIPWQAEAALAALVFVGLGFKYIKEALDFDDGDDIPAVTGQ